MYWESTIPRVAAARKIQAARYAAIPFRRHLIVVMLMSGAIAGLAGMLEVAGTAHRLQGGISNNFGYIGKRTTGSQAGADGVAGDMEGNRGRHAAGATSYHDVLLPP